MVFAIGAFVRKIWRSFESARGEREAVIKEHRQTDREISTINIRMSAERVGLVLVPRVASGK